MMFLQVYVDSYHNNAKASKVAIGCSLNKTAQWRFAVYGHWSFHIDYNDCVLFGLCCHGVLTSEQLLQATCD